MTAGAGSGKTWVIVEKVRHVVRQGAARPDEIAVITFTNKATEAVRSRLQDIDGVAVETIHGLAMQVIERQGLGRPQISPLANDKNTHRRLTLLSAISEFPKWRKYLILLSFLDNSSARPDRSAVLM